MLISPVRHPEALSLCYYDHKVGVTGNVRMKFPSWGWVKYRSPTEKFVFLPSSIILSLIYVNAALCVCVHSLQ